MEAAEIQGAPFWLRTLAADLLARGGDRAASRRMWTQMFEQGEEGIIRENARAQLRALDSLDLADAVGEAAAEFERRHGRRPARARRARERRALAWTARRRGWNPVAL